ncbi:hypothetical protein BKA66DRAFT_572183 [Pyrenochaeta sp. MPI-SDFR-AT-0127]|nr:hypothetical protein BKA66DRAFT_572183 [Pyrenochaeta sp. MPI-SDFR-AT-0127]
MSTLSSSEANTPLARDIAVTAQCEHLSCQAALAPGSASDDGLQSEQAHSIINAAPTLDTQGYNDLNTDIPHKIQSILSQELTHDVNGAEHTRSHSKANRYPSESESDSRTVRGLLEGQSRLITKSYTVGHGVQGQHSSRKSIPSQWLPKGNGPILATAQRAKERSEKKSSQSGSPIEAKTLRGTRSSVELAVGHGLEGAIFLTKEALAAVENSMTSPKVSRSPNRLHQSQSRPSWKSPTGSPLRSSPRQQSTLSVNISPTKPAFLKAESSSVGYSRGPSSAATSTSKNSFHTAEGSPVRSPVGSELSFQSAVEAPEGIEVPYFDLTADSGNQQASQDLNNMILPPLSAMAVVKTRSVRPKLALKIPLPDLSSENDPISVSTSTLNALNTATSMSPNCSPTQISRIPRVTAAHKAGIVRSATRGTILEQKQSVKSLRSRNQAHQQGPSTTLAPQLPASHTLDERVPQDSCPTNNPVEFQSERVDDFALHFKRISLAELTDISHSCVSGNTSRATSNATVNAQSALQDPVLMDSAIIYSRKKSDAFGTTLNHLTSFLSLLVVPAYDSTLGISKKENSGNSTRSAACNHLITPSIERQEKDKLSTQSTLASGLRATAPDFVPQTASMSYLGGFPTQKTTAAQPKPLMDAVDLSGLDMHGIPWMYYMYPIHFAYEQGFRNGRCRSPKKYKPKKPRTLARLHNHHLEPGITVAEPLTKATTMHLSERSHPEASIDLMVPPPMHTGRQQASVEREDCQPGLKPQTSKKTIAFTEDSYPSFSAQIDLITQQTTLQNCAKSITPHLSNVDLTTIRNVGFPNGPRYMHTPSYNTAPRRHQRQGFHHSGNGLYSNRGAVGVPVDDTVPFPSPVPPQGRPEGRVQSGHKQRVGYTVGAEACGIVDIAFAAERGGGDACNACAPDH